MARVKLDGMLTFKQKKGMFGMMNDVLPVRWAGFYMMRPPVRESSLFLARGVLHVSAAVSTRGAVL